MALLQEEEHLFKIRKMIKGIRFNINHYFAATLHRTITYSMLVYFMMFFIIFRGEKKSPKILTFCFRKKNIIEQFSTK